MWLSLNTFSCLIHVIACISMSFFFIYSCIIFHLLDRPYFIYPFISWWMFGYFHLLTTVNKASMSILIHVFVWISVSNIFHTYIALELLSHDPFHFQVKLCYSSAQNSLVVSQAEWKWKCLQFPARSLHDLAPATSHPLLAHFAPANWPPYWSSGSRWCPIPGLCTWLFCLELSSLLPHFPPASVQITTLFKTEHTSPLPRCVVLHLT